MGNIEKRILIVDDSQEYLTLMRLAFREFGPELQIAGSGYAASELMKVRNYDLVLTDVEMPSGSGIWLLKFVRGLSPKTKVLIMTGGTTTTREEALRCGADDFIHKTEGAKAIVALVKAHLTESATDPQAKTA